MAKKRSTPQSWGGGGHVYDSLPKGWRENKGATTAPNGYSVISNGKSRFSPNGEYKNGIIKTSRLRRSSGTNGG